MPAYAIAHLRSVDVGEDIMRYLAEIDATLEQYNGRFIVHGGQITVVEGDWPGNLVIVEFPDRERATAWYESPEYRAILPLRTENSDSSAIIVDGVPPDYQAKQLLESMG